MWFPALDRRVLEPEIMDDPALDPRDHLAALRGLDRLHRVGSTARLLVAPVLREARGIDRPLRIVDVACGGGELLLDVVRAARRRGVRVEATGLDRSDVALDYARARATERGIPVRFERFDVDGDPIRGADYDVALCSLFLHHRDDPGAIRLVRLLSRLASRLVVLHDLDRTRLGYFLAWLAPRLLWCSPVVRADAVVSVRAAFSADEARDLCLRAGVGSVSMRRAWPARFVLEWRP